MHGRLFGAGSVHMSSPHKSTQQLAREAALLRRRLRRAKRELDSLKKAAPKPAMSNSGIYRREELLQRYEFIVNSVDDMMSVINPNYEYEVVNDAWCHATQRAR